MILLLLIVVAGTGGELLRRSHRRAGGRSGTDLRPAALIRLMSVPAPCKTVMWLGFLLVAIRFLLTAGDVSRWRT